MQTPDFLVENKFEGKKLLLCKALIIIIVVFHRKCKRNAHIVRHSMYKKMFDLKN